MRRLITLTLLILLVAPTTAHASIFDIYGYNPRGIAMGGAMTAAVNDFTAAYYNPGALTVPKKVILGIGWTATFPRLKINRQTRNPDFPNIIPSKFVSGLTLGVLFPIGGPLRNKLAFGFGLYFPTTKLIRAEGLEPQSPQFYSYQSSPEKLIVLASIAYEPWRYISFGVGIQVLARILGDVSLNVDVLNDQLQSSDISVEVIPTANVVAGIHARPFPQLSIGVSYRAALALTYRLPARMAFGSPITLNLDIGGTMLYAPHQINFGVAYHFLKPQLTLALDFNYAIWATAPDPSPQLKVDVGGSLLDGLGLGSAVDIGSTTPPIKMRFRNTLTVRIGAEYGPLPWLKLRAGYFYRPTPVPNQSQAYNYLDNDSHGISFGVSFTIANPLEVHRRPFTIDLATQFLLLPNRTALKSDPNDPVGNLSHSGAVYSLAIALRHDF